MAEESKPKSYLTGAMILTAANLGSQFLGLFSKIAILWLLGDEGVGIYNYPYAIYSILLSFSSVGFNVAISKLVAERISQKQHRLALRVFDCSLRVMIALGFVAALILVILAWPLSIFVHKDPRAFYAYLALAPSALLNSWQAAYRGFFQGTQNMRPNAFSQIVEQVGRILAMLGFAALLLPKGLEWGAAGAVLGAAAGAIASFLFLKQLFKRAMTLSPWKQALDKPPKGHQPSNRFLYQEILRYAIPISFAGIGLPLYLLADSMLIVNRLLSSGSELAAATAAYGAYANNAMSLISLPTVLSSSLFVSLVPAISEARASEDHQSILLQSRSALKISLLLALPAAAGMYLVAEPLCHLLGMGEMTVVALKALVAAIPFLVIQQVTAGILQGLNRAKEPLITMAMGAILKAVITWIFTGQYGVAGAAMGTILGFALASLLNLALLLYDIGPVLDLNRALLRPLASTMLMFAAVAAIKPLLQTLSSPLQLAIEVLLGVLCYLLGLVLLGVLTEEDTQFLPLKGRLRHLLIRDQ